MKRKTSQISVRLGDDLLTRLDRVCSMVGLDTTTVTKACIEAFCEEVEDKGGIWLPLKVVPKKSPTADLSNVESTAARGSRSVQRSGVGLAAEEPAKFSTSSGRGPRSAV